MRATWRRLAFLAVLSAPVTPAHSQLVEPLPDTTLSSSAKSQIIERLLSELDRGYVFPERAKEMAAAINSRLARGEYADLTSAMAFADSLTSHLQAVSHDKHLRVRYGTPRPPARPGGADDISARAKADNYGIGEPRRLDGNIAYLEISSFGFPPDMIEDAVTQAMTKVADADALIIDVRANGGGSPESVALVSSYLFGAEPVHLNSLYFRPADQTTDFYTRATVQGKRFGASKPVFVLTSRRTFSAAEEFTYNLQALKRATIVGDTTGGGAHPGGVRVLPNHFAVFVPNGRAINPITKTNWEGTGVRPDIAVASDRALDAAQEAARSAIKRATQ